MRQELTIPASMPSESTVPRERLKILINRLRTNPSTVGGCRGAGSEFYVSGVTSRSEMNTAPHQAAIP